MSKAKSVVRPLIVLKGATSENVLKVLIDSKDAPLLKSIGFRRASETSQSWVSYTVTTKGDKVISIEVDEPNMRQVAEESAKINFVTLFTDAE